MEQELSALRPFLDADGRLTALPAKERKKRMALWYLAGKLEDGRLYSEPEINALLDEWTLFHDPAALRREMYNKRLVDRTADGGRYWKGKSIPPLAAFMDGHA